MERMEKSQINELEEVVGEYLQIYRRASSSNGHSTKLRSPKRRVNYSPVKNIAALIPKSLSTLRLFDFYQLLYTNYEIQQFNFPIIETLFFTHKDKAFFYYSNSKIKRVAGGKAVDSFFDHCKNAFEQSRYTYPKFVVKSSSSFIFLYTAESAKLAIEKEKTGRIQRFIQPIGDITSKLRIHWKEGFKSTYCLMTNNRTAPRKTNCKKTTGNTKEGLNLLLAGMKKCMLELKPGNLSIFSLKGKKTDKGSPGTVSPCRAPQKTYDTKEKSYVTSSDDPSSFQVSLLKFQDVKIDRILEDLAKFIEKYSVNMKICEIVVDFLRDSKKNCYVSEIVQALKYPRSTATQATPNISLSKKYKGKILIAGITEQITKSRFVSPPKGELLRASVMRRNTVKNSKRTFKQNLEETIERHERACWIPKNHRKLRAYDTNDSVQFYKNTRNINTKGQSDPIILSICENSVEPPINIAAIPLQRVLISPNRPNENASSHKEHYIKQVSKFRRIIFNVKKNRNKLEKGLEKYGGTHFVKKIIKEIFAQIRGVDALKHLLVDLSENNLKEIKQLYLRIFTFFSDMGSRKKFLEYHQSINQQQLDLNQYFQVLSETMSKHGITQLDKSFILDELKFILKCNQDIYKLT